MGGCHGTPYKSEDHIKADPSERDLSDLTLFLYGGAERSNAMQGNAML